MSKALPADERKALGAFYTDEAVARYLVRWGLRKPGAAVMDPSCGDGRFLRLAGKLGAGRLVGCDIASEAVATARECFSRAGLDAELYTSDFFAIEPEALSPVDLVVGNPPFIRYQSFNGSSRRRALKSALRLGARLTGLTSSWAPFLLHAVQFLKPGGSLGMVVPAEITQTQYGQVALRALLSRFGSVRLMTFEQNLFQDAQQETCLLLASDQGASCEEVRLMPLSSIHSLEDAEDSETPHATEVPIAFGNDKVVRFAEAFLTPEERRAWGQLRHHPDVRRIASVATVTNGYVSGDNDFFHRTRRQAQGLSYPEDWLVPVARNSRSLRGIFFTGEDIVELESEGAPHHLLVPQDDLFASDRSSLSRLIEEGEQRGTSQRYKCRTREPWWKVPGLVEADVLVTYMAGSFPRASVNQVGAFYVNSLHGLKLRKGVSPESMALGLYSSLSLLSLEVEGRSYGGGILKLEPREFDRVLVACPKIPQMQVRKLAASVDAMLRVGQYEKAVQEVDRTLLTNALGLTGETIERVRTARKRLMDRRAGRTRRSCHNGPSSKSATFDRDP